jgi:hypothetical protein
LLSNERAPALTARAALGYYPKMATIWQIERQNAA